METIQKRLIGKEDISWDLSGNNEQNNYVFGNDSVAVSKINASHIPLTAEARDFLSAGNVDNALKNVHKKLNEFSASDGLTEDVVVEFEANDTVEDIQQKINLQKKNLNGHTLTFVFPRFLEQILSETIVFKGFFNGAVIVTGGDENNLIPIYDQFDITSLFKIYRCQCEFIVEYFYFTHSHSKYAVLAESSTAVIFRNCVFAGIKGGDSFGVKLFASFGDMVDCNFVDDDIWDERFSPASSAFLIGSVFAFPASVPPEGAYLLNGQTITNCRELYPKFWEWVNTAGVQIIDNTTYESELASAGVCGGFVVSGTSVRLPNVVNGTLWGADSSNIGQSLASGLPNITGSIMAISNASGANAPQGAFWEDISAAYNEYQSSANGSRGATAFDASRSNPIYGNSATVQPPAIRVSWCIQVYNAATALSEQQSAQLASQMQMKAQTDFGNVAENLDFVVESWKASDGSSWYRKYRSGWVEQGGHTSTGATADVITLPVEFADTDYTVLVASSKRTTTDTDTGGGQYIPTVGSYTTTSFRIIRTSANPPEWEAKGYAATE